MDFQEIFLQANPFLIKILSVPFCIIATLLSFKFLSKLLNKLSYRQQTFSLCILNAALMLLIILGYIFINHHNNLIINLLYISVFIYLLALEIEYINRLHKNKTTAEKIKLLELDNQNLTTKYEELSAFHHDFNNIIQTIGSLLAIGKYDNLKRYYKGLEIDCQTLNDMELLNINKIKNPEILSLLLNKYEVAKQNGIRMNLEIYSDLSNINTDIFQIIRILGILLDNAIEATTECEEKILNIEFKSKNNYQIITIENSYIDKEIDTEELFKKGFSTKPGNRGLGLWKVQKIVQSHKNINLTTSQDDEYFTQKLTIEI